MEEYATPGWPGRIELMFTGSGTQISEFRTGGDDLVEEEDGRYITLPADRRYNRLLGIEEEGGYYGDTNKYHSAFVYDVMDTAINRVIECLQGKLRENFAEN